MMTATLQLTRTWAALGRYWPLMLAALVKPDLRITLRRK